QAKPPRARSESLEPLAHDLSGAAKYGQLFPSDADAVLPASPAAAGPDARVVVPGEAHEARRPAPAPRGPVHPRADLPELLELTREPIRLRLGAWQQLEQDRLPGDAVERDVNHLAAVLRAEYLRRAQALVPAQCLEP